MKFKIYFYSIIFISLLGCKKDFLEIRTDKSLLVPTKLSDFQSLLDNYSLMNLAPVQGVIANGDYVLGDQYLQNLQPLELNSYLWKDNVYSGLSVSDWNIPYKQVFTANVVLDGLLKVKINTTNQEEWNSIKGSALFFRAFALFNISQIYAPAFQESTAGNLPGIPVRTQSDVNIKVGRGTLKQTYDQIIDDLVHAEMILPVAVNFKNRPSRVAAKALLARVYLIMGNYAQAGFYANECLKINNSLINYNDLDVDQVLPFPNPLPNGNDEIIFNNTLISHGFFLNGYIQVDKELYDSYGEYDLRKSLFYNEDENKGVYFTGYEGLCIDEMYLIRAECFVRNGNRAAGLADLNTLISHRWIKDKFQPYESSSDADALQLIVRERRKELIGRDLRWSDLRRLNQDPLFAVTLTREVIGKVYILVPDDKRYTFLIPHEEVSRNKITQNIR